jgi:tetratricopeptide (TPR) repeat protein
MDKQRNRSFLLYTIHFQITIVLLLCLSVKPAQASLLKNSNLIKSELFYQGIEQINNHNYQEALSNFTQIIEEKSDFIGAAYSNRCLVHLQLENNQAAKSDCSAALKLNPENTEAYLNLGLAEYKLGNYDAALEQYQKIIQKNKDDYRAYYNQGLANFAQKNYEKALISYDRALRLSDISSTFEKALIYSDRGLVNLTLGNKERAIADLTEAINWDSNNERAYYNRACAYHKNRNYQEAIADFTKVLQLNPQYAQAYVNRGLLQHQLGLENAAIKDLTTALHYFAKQEQLVAYQETLNLIKKLQQTIAQFHRTEFS